MTNIFPKIFVISLLSATARRQNIEEQMRRQSIPFEFIDAIDGKLLQKSDVRIQWDEVKKFPVWLTPGALGCSLSHLAAYEKIVQLNLPYAIILEDDCVLLESFSIVLQELSSLMTENSVLMFYYASWNILELKKSTVTTIRSFQIAEANNIDGLITTTAYCISNGAARKMNKNLYPVRVSADKWDTFYANNLFDVIRFVYPMCCDTADFKSSIDYLENEKMKKGVSLFIEKNRIFPLYQILKLKRRRFKKNLHRVVIK